MNVAQAKDMTDDAKIRLQPQPLNTGEGYDGRCGVQDQQINSQLLLNSP